MRVALLGRNKTILETGDVLQNQGHEIVLLATGRAAPEYSVGIEEFRSAAESWGCRILDRVDHAELEAVLNQTRPDIGVSINYPVILPESITSIPKHGILNAHGGDLPRFRGNACQAWAIILGEPRIGLCIHRMVGGTVDAGDIVARKYLPINDSTKIGEILNWMDCTVPGLFLESLSALVSDPFFILERQSQDPQDSLRCFPRRPEDGRIDWNNEPLQIVRLVNASGAPYAGAYCFYNNQKVIIDSALITNVLQPYLAVFGQVLDVKPSSVVVACRNGAIEITRARFEDGTIWRSVVNTVRARFT